MVADVVRIFGRQRPDFSAPCDAGQKLPRTAPRRNILQNAGAKDFESISGNMSFNLSGVALITGAASGKSTHEL